METGGEAGEHTSEPVSGRLSFHCYNWALISALVQHICSPQRPLLSQYSICIWRDTGYRASRVFRPSLSITVTSSTSLDSAPYSLPRFALSPHTSTSSYHNISPVPTAVLVIACCVHLNHHSTSSHLLQLEFSLYLISPSLPTVQFWSSWMWASQGIRTRRL